MFSFNNPRKDYSIRPPKQAIANNAFYVIDSANIDFTYNTISKELIANLTETGVIAGTYGSSTIVPVITLDVYGRITGVTTATIPQLLLQTNGIDNPIQTILNLIAGTNMTITDDGLGNITFDATGGSGSGTVTSVSAGTGMNFTTITTSGSVAIDTTKVPYLAAGFSTGLLKWNGSAWVFDTSTYLTTISGLNISLLTNDSGYITSAALTGYVPYTGATADVDLGLFDITAAHLIKDGGVATQFLKADGSIDNNVYLTSADLPSTLNLFATTTADPIIAGYSVLVRNILDPRFNTVAVNVPTGAITTTNQFLSSLISDTNVISGNPGLFNITTIGNIRKISGSGDAEFFFRIYKRDSAGTETFITQSNNTLPVTNGGYSEFSATALWNNGVFLSTDRIVVKYYGNRIAGGSNPSYEFQFGGIAPVRTAAAVPVAVLPNIYLSNLVDVEDIPALPNEVLYWNDTANLWEHSLVNDLVVATKSVQNISSNLELVGDLLAPGNNKVYGTDGTGVKGWKADPTSSGNSIQALTGDVTASASSPSQSVAATLKTNLKIGSCGVIFTTVSGVITNGTTGYAQVPYSGTITGWTLVSNISGSCTVTAFKDTYANYPPIISTDNIFTVQPALVSQIKNQNLSPTFVGSQATVTAGDWIGFTISGVTTVSWVNLTLSITKT